MPTANAPTVREAALAARVAELEAELRARDDFLVRTRWPNRPFDSSSDATHDVLLTLYRNRFSQQIETTTSDTILACWE